MSGVTVPARKLLHGARLNIIFWSIVAVDATLFIGLLVTYAAIPGANSSGGKEMGIFFFGVLPLVALALSALLFYYSRSAPWKYLALAIVLGPGLIYASSQIHNGLIDYRIRQKQLGRWYFKDTNLKLTGSAVVQADLPALSRFAPEVDLNTVGESGMTLLRLAAEQVPSDELASEKVRTTVAVVQELLRLGAAPDPGLDIALKAEDPALLQALLAHGANPNAQTKDGRPVVFVWLRVMPANHLKLLIEKGLNINVMEYQTSLALTAALNRRFDLLLLLAQNGADLLAPREDGRTIASELASRAAEAQSENREPAAELAPIGAILTAQMQGFH